MSIVIDNKTNTISTNDDKPIVISKNGCIKIGNGTHLDESGLYSDAEGCLRYNFELKCYQYFNGREWISLSSEEVTQKNNYIWSYLF